MQNWWAIIIFGAVIPAGMMGMLVLRDHLAGEPDSRDRHSRRIASGSRFGPSRR